MQPAGRADVIRFEQRLQKRLQAVLDAIPVAVSWARLDDQRIEFVNSKFTAMFGYALGDHDTVTTWITTAYPDADQVERARKMWLHHFGNITSDTVEIPQVEVDVRCKNGTVKTTLLGGVILPDVGWALATFVDITERKVAEAHIERLALEDPLTDLPNRRAFSRVHRRALARALRQGARMALLLIDVDGLKPVNDTFGHDQGDALLKTVAQRLLAVIRGEDMVCRIGGDEFAVVVDGIRTAAAAEEVAARMVQEVAKPFSLLGTDVPVSVSVGVGVFPDDAATEEDLYKKADVALYGAKKAGGNRWQR